jgi:amino acid transporter
MLRKKVEHKASDKIGYLGITAIGVGGMVGGGIFAVLGIAVQLAQGGAPVAFMIAGIVALVTSYSYTRLSVTYPSQGGTVAFLDRAFGPGLITGSVNILLWISYMVMLSLYAYAFGSYGSALFPQASRDLWKHVLISISITGVTGLNLLSTRLVGETEEVIVVIKLAILLLFAGFGVWGIKGSRLEPVNWSSPLNLVSGGMIIFLAYEGFELIANTAKDVREPSKTLPRAFYSSVGFVIVLYVLIAAVTIGNLPVKQIVGAKDYALAEAARPFLGQTGYLLITIAALLSTFSAINATVYGAARLSYIIAKDGELPDELERKVWNQPIEGLLITSGITLFLANFLDLSSISVMGSAGFLLIFMAVNTANAVLAKETKSQQWLSIIGALLCLGAFCCLIWQTATNTPRNLWVLAGMVMLAFLIESCFRLLTSRKIRLKSAR